MSFRVHLDEALASRHYELDAAQRAAAERLERLCSEWQIYKTQRANVLHRLFYRPDIPKGVYLWGGVGRGKSFLMDIFFAHVPIVRKTRVHFHEFMRGVHRSLEKLKGVEDPLEAVGEQIARRARLICFDEFHISDIADAMLLHRLLNRLMSLQVGFVMTSNYAPDDLYPDGLHRDRLLPAIGLLKSRLDIVQVDGGIDYRQRHMTEVEVYWVTEAHQTETSLDARMDHVFTHLSEAEDDAPDLTIEGRTLKALRRAGGIVWFDFLTLCASARSQNDYLELAAQFHTILLSGVPRMSSEQAAQARRFTWLIDVLYEHKIKLVVSAGAQPEALYTEGQLASEFVRTASRLREMQSAQYLRAPRLEVKHSF